MFGSEIKLETSWGVFDFMKVFPTFDTGLREVEEVTFSGRQAIGHVCGGHWREESYRKFWSEKEPENVPEWIKESRTWGSHVREVIEAIANGNGCVDPCEEGESYSGPTCHWAAYDKKTLVYTTTDGTSFGWRERQDGTYEFGVTHPSANDRQGAPEDSGMRYSAWVAGWFDQYGKRLETPVAAIKRQAEEARARRNFRQISFSDFVAQRRHILKGEYAKEAMDQDRWDASTVNHAKSFDEDCHEYGNGLTVEEMFEAIITEDSKAFERGVFLSKEQQVRLDMLRQMQSRPEGLTSEEYEEILIETARDSFFEGDTWIEKIRKRVDEKNPPDLFKDFTDAGDF